MSHSEVKKDETDQNRLCLKSRESKFLSISQKTEFG